jgi:acyl-coenzyme A synthetase/AMP-(fatty) acid ligase/3-hydroxymyristoyl/3-hydroxydecanoyl-(acyl carrier protein) dehydratase
MPSPRNRIQSLASLLAGKPDHAPPVSFDRTGTRSRAELQDHVVALAGAIASADAGRWLLCCDDTYQAAVGLLALARCGAVAVLPPNRQPETLRQLAGDCAGAVWDAAGRRDCVSAGIDALGIDALAPPVRAFAPVASDRDRPLAEFLTSGTTGAGRAVTKAPRHLEDEVQALESRLGSQLAADTRIFATASHQHIYGLLFGLIWPLTAGRAFQSEPLLHARELFPRMAECDSAALVTTPVHLKRIAASGGLRSLRGICRAVFSSGGPLDAETAKAVAEQLGTAPIEVFGSTETGGVATRRRDTDGEAWVPLPGVEIRRGDDGRLEVTSPYVSVGETVADGRGRTLMGDRVEVASDGSFLLRGRADRVVKVGEKRLALPEMESVLEGHPYVSEAALLVREQAGVGRVHAVVAASDDGRAALERDGRRGFGAELTRHLSGSFDPVLLPRAWRSVEALPRDAQDKVTTAALEALFRDAPEPALSGSAPDPRRPRVLREERCEDAFEQELEVNDSLPQLEGHFEGFPVVAGVVQLDWAVAAATTWLGTRPVLAGVEALKFPRPLRPGRTVTLRLERAGGGRALRFQLRDGDAVFASGRLLVAGAER